MAILQMYYAPTLREVELRLPRPLQPNRPFDLNTVVPHLVAWPNEPWVDLVNAAKDKFEVDDAIAVFSTWRVHVQGEDGNGFRLVSDAHMTDGRAARLLGSIPEGGLSLRLKFLQRTGQGDWFIGEKMDPIRSSKEGAGNCYNN